jgi:hypothetical protein
LLNLQQHKARLIKDLIAILFFLSTGLIGLICASDPIRFLQPRLPVLSTEDWPRSRTLRELSDDKYGEGYQEFRIDLEINNSPHLKNPDKYQEAKILQRATWYNDPEKAREAWESDLREFQRLGWQPVIVKSKTNERPASCLLCHPYFGESYVCEYAAYYRHWHIRLQFHDNNKSHSMADIEEILKKADTLLMGAPDKLQRW